MILGAARTHQTPQGIALPTSAFCFSLRGGLDSPSGKLAGNRRQGLLGTNTAIGLSGRVEAVGLARTDFTQQNYSRSIMLDLRDTTDLVEVIPRKSRT